MIQRRPAWLYTKLTRKFSVQVFWSEGLEPQKKQWLQIKKPRVLVGWVQAQEPPFPCRARDPVLRGWTWPAPLSSSSSILTPGSFPLPNMYLLNSHRRKVLCYQRLQSLLEIKKKKKSGVSLKYQERKRSFLRFTGSLKRVRSRL